MTFKKINLIPSKTYHSVHTMETAIENLKKKFDPNFVDGAFVRYIESRTPEGRYYPIFVANQSNSSIVIHLVHEGFCIVS